MFRSLFSVLERDLSGLSTWHESIGWRKTHVLHHSLTERFLIKIIYIYIYIYIYIKLFSVKLIRKRYLKQHKIKEKNRVGWGGGEVGKYIGRVLVGLGGRCPFDPYSHIHVDL